jgi:hypothetical protein
MDLLIAIRKVPFATFECGSVRSIAFLLILVSSECLTFPSDDVQQIREETEGYSNSMKFWKSNPASRDCGRSRLAFGFAGIRKLANDLVNSFDATP